MELSSATLPVVTDTVAGLGVPSHGLSLSHIFVPKRWNRFFAIYVVRLALYVCLKNICDGVGSQNGSNGTPLDPPLFWLDNIFKGGVMKQRNRMGYTNAVCTESE